MPTTHGRKAVNFDLNDNLLKKYYPSKSYKNAWRDIKKFLLKNDFSELKSHNRLMYKYCHTLLENKLDKFYFQTKYLYRFIIKEEI